MTLPQSVLDLVEFSPVEDLLLAIVRAGLPDVKVGSLVEADQTFPYVLVRRNPVFGEWDGDPRFIDAAQIKVDVFCDGLNADDDAALLSEAVRVVLRDAWLNQTVVPGIGYLAKLNMVEAPRRVPDWNTAAGPVQYADLPTGVYRYETKYKAFVRRLNS